MKINRYILIVCIIGLTGCSSGIRQTWYDFRAYYNTLYNAIQYYETGLNSHLSQQTDINPERPIRIHTPPSGVGIEDFTNAIETATDVIQRYSRSSYRDQALEIIGKSHYYSENYFAALEVFINIYENSPDVHNRQNAAIWEGRVYLEMGIPEEGISILLEKLESGIMQSDAERAELLLIIAQMHSELGSFTQAAELISIATGDVDNYGMRARGLFLLGQLYEFDGQPESAIDIYNLVLENRPSFDLEYQARRKTGELYRKTGRYGLALEQFRAMQRDDKFRNRLPEIVYELARTEHLRGDLTAAVNMYNSVLRNRDRQAEELTLTKVYYSLAEVNENVFVDLQTAAAYYDSASFRQIDRELLPVDWDIEENAYAFGEYANIRSSLAEMEIRLSLGLMDPEERSAALEVIRNELEEVEVENPQGQPMSLQVPDDVYSETDQSTNTFGFLNINNPVMVESDHREFTDFWGERPLVDNWRRREAAFGTRPVAQAFSAEDNPEESDIPELLNQNPEEIPFTDIPVTEEAQQQLRLNMNELHYRLGNLFLLNLQMPDSANIYFQKVLDSDTGEELKPRALFGLIEVALQQNDESSAEILRNRLFEEYPESAAADELLNRSGEETANPIRSDSVQIQYSTIITDSLTALERAEMLHKLALENEHDPRSAQILLDSASEFIRSSYSRESDQIDDVLIDSARTVLVRLDSLFQGSAENSRGQLLLQELNSTINDSTGAVNE